MTTTNAAAERSRIAALRARAERMANRAERYRRDGFTVLAAETMRGAHRAERIAEHAESELVAAMMESPAPECDGCGARAECVTGATDASPALLRCARCAASTCGELWPLSDARQAMADGSAPMWLAEILSGAPSEPAHSPRKWRGARDIWSAV